MSIVACLRGSMGALFTCLLVATVVAANAQPATAAGEAQARASSSVFGDSVVGLETQATRGASSIESLGSRRRGSGVVIGEQLVLTIGYLLLEADQVTVTTALGRRIPAAVAGYDHASGLGLVRTALPLGVGAAALGDSDAIGDRQRVLTQGFGEPSATELVVISRKVFAGSWEYLLERPIYTFPPVRNWSGSALFSADGRLLGVGSLIVKDAAATERDVPGNLFVPVNLLKPILKDLVEAGRRRSPALPWLGMSTELVDGRLTVVRVSKDGPADQAGIEAGDVVLGVGAESVSDLADFYRRVWGHGAAGVLVPLAIDKAGRGRRVQVRTMDRSDFITRPGGV